MGYRSNRSRSKYVGSAASARAGVVYESKVRGSFSLGVLPYSKDWNEYECFGAQPNHAIHMSVCSNELASFLDQRQFDNLSLFSEPGPKWALSPVMVVCDWAIETAPIPENVKRSVTWASRMERFSTKNDLPAISPGVLRLAIDHLRATYHGVNVDEGIIVQLLDKSFDGQDSEKKLQVIVEMSYRAALAELSGMDVRKLVVGNEKSVFTVEGRALTRMLDYGYRLALLLNACWVAFVVEEEHPPFVD